MHKRHDIYGLTLIEMVIAMILLTFIGMNLIQFFNNICSVELRSKNRTTAVKTGTEDYGGLYVQGSELLHLYC